MDDVTIAGQHHHQPIAQVAGDRGSHGVFPYALGLVEKFEIGFAMKCVSLEDCLEISPMGGIGCVDVGRQILPVASQQTVDAADPDFRESVGRG
jgi:hypothetical protein